MNNTANNTANTDTAPSMLVNPGLVQKPEQDAEVRITPGLLQQRAQAQRAQIAANLNALERSRRAVADRRSVKLSEIERMRRAVAEYDAALVACDEERTALLEMDDALAQEMLTLERVQRRRTEK
jgi:septal ring factor EnvC (AmiA/AmiB activator)